MNKPFFSVIVPVYKVEKYIERCVNSILDQTYQNFELILVDDGSPDSCPEICDSYSERDSRIKVIHKDNGGSSDARNVGLSFVKSFSENEEIHYVTFLDSDDMWCDVNLLLDLSKEICKNKSDVILYGCKIVKEDESEEITRSNYNINNNVCLDKEWVLQHLLESGNMPGSAWIMCVSLNLINNNNLKFRKGVTAEDFEWVVTILLAANRISAIDGIHYAYFRREGSITTFVKLSGILGTSSAINKYYEMNQLSPALENYLARIYLLAVMSFNRLSNMDRKEASHILKQDLKILQDSGQYLYYLFVRIFGFRISSYVIRKLYMLIR